MIYLWKFMEFRHRVMMVINRKHGSNTKNDITRRPLRHMWNQVKLEAEKTVIRHFY